MLRILIIFILPFSLLACSNTSVTTLVDNGDWFSLGEYDASNGLVEKTEKRLLKLSEKQSAGEVVYSDYLAGYKKQLVIYCEPKNAYVLGITGQTYNNICARFPSGREFYQDWMNSRSLNSGSGR